MHKKHIIFLLFCLLIIPVCGILDSVIFGYLSTYEYLYICFIEAVIFICGFYCGVKLYRAFVPQRAKNTKKKSKVSHFWGVRHK